MPRLPRPVVPGIPHHVTQRGTRKQDIFFLEEDRHTYLRYVSEASEKYGVKILAWCLMSNHVHFAAVPEDEESLAKCFGSAHKRYSRMINFRNEWSGFLFQGRFGSSAMDPTYTYHTLRYILRNPVRADMVRVPWRYEWSSAAYHLGKEKSDPLVTRDDKIDKMVGDWSTFLAEPDADEYLCQIRRESAVGRPLGDDRFLKKLENKLNRNLKRGKPGRPRKKKR